MSITDKLENHGMIFGSEEHRAVRHALGKGDEDLPPAPWGADIQAMALRLAQVENRMVELQRQMALVVARGGINQCVDRWEPTLIAIEEWVKFAGEARRGEARGVLRRENIQRAALDGNTDAIRILIDVAERRPKPVWFGY